MLSRLLDYVNLADALFSSGRYAESLTAAEVGLGYTPDVAALHVSRGKALVMLERFDEAEESAQTALRLDPNLMEAHTTLGFAYEGRGEHERGIACARDAIAIDAQSHQGHGALATMLLWRGDLLAGMPEQEFHWLPEAAYLVNRFASDPCWDSGDPVGMRLLLVHNQGLGDLIQMARYFPLLRERVQSLIVECPDTLRALIERIPGVDMVVERGDPVITGQYDAYARVMSLPRLFGTELGTIPSAVPYLSTDPDRRAAWRTRMGAGDGLRVGIAWSGNPLNWRDRERSMSLDTFAPLAPIPGIRWFSLQNGEHADDEAPDGMNLLRLGADFTTLDDAAAAIEELDLIISVDSSLCHLAGALAKPVWTLVQRRPDWRWQRTGDTTPWYPTMRLFRQQALGDWDSVIAQVFSELQTRLVMR
jgi:tetratricopeptide (TPR) repeat protein